MKTDNLLQVFYDNRLVGTLAMTVNHKVAFEYSEEWMECGFSISPFSLPMKKQVFIPQKDYFGGLFGVFADSLPDAWGQLLLSRLLKKYIINPDDLSVLDRLSIVGESGMGALTYKPQKEIYEKQNAEEDLDELANQCRKILNTEYTDKLDELYYLGGTSGGARPKIMTEINGEQWIIKFPAKTDIDDIGKMEYDYAICAKKCGIDVSEVKLFPSNKCKGYFGTKRFDRNGTKKIHMLTAAAILEHDYEQPSLDYSDLMKLTNILTFGNRHDIENMFRRMCFNVFAHNRDDHSKNFSYIYMEDEELWRLSPAYDLTYSSTYYGEHTTTVAGNGKNPGIKELMAVGVEAGMNKNACKNIAEIIRENVNEMLGKYMK